MNIWEIRDPVHFSIAYYYGSWSRRNTCKHCGRNGRNPIPPTIVEWEKENDEIGDFTHVGRSYCLLIKKAIFDEIHSFLNPRGTRAEGVLYHRASWSKAKKHDNSLKSKLTPELIHLNVDNIFTLDYENSTVEIKDKCAVCGRKSTSLTGRTFRFNSPEVKSVDFFRTDPEIPYIFCSDRAKNFIESRNYTNIRFEKFELIE